MICLYTGRRGAGKTLTAVKDCFLYHQAGWNVYSNMDSLSFEHTYVDNKGLAEFADDDDIRDVVLLIDEVQTLMNARRSNRKENVNMTYFIQQIRKRNIIILATTQFIHTVDKVFRMHVDVEVTPHMFGIDSSFSKSIPDDVVVECVRAEYLDVTSVHNVGDTRSTCVYFLPSDVYGMYNTDETIKDVRKSSDD